ncbi:MAG: hypothetical protein ACLFVO_14660 [Chloroflexaceae bacterium]
MLLGLGGIMLPAALGVGAFLAWERVAPGPAVETFTTAQGLVEDGTIVGETQVFAPGDTVFLVFALAGGRAGQTVTVQIDGAAAEERSYELQEADAGRGAVTFTPSEAGTYRAELLLPNEPEVEAQTTFEVRADGPRLEQVMTAGAIDQATFMPVNRTTIFSPTDTVYITYRVVDAEVGDTVHIQYEINEFPQPEDPDDTVTFETEGPLRGHFALRGNQLPLSEGTYRAELFYNDTLVEVVTFKVEV